MSLLYGAKFPVMSTARAAQAPHPASAPIPPLAAAPRTVSANISAAASLTAAAPLPTLATILAPRRTSQQITYRERAQYLQTSSLLDPHQEVVPISRNPAALVFSYPLLPAQKGPSTPAVYADLSHSTAPETSRSARIESPPQNVATSFQELVLDMLSNQSFPLVPKKVLELSTGGEVIVPHIGARQRSLDGDMRTLSTFANAHGVPEACASSSSLEVFLAATLTALENLKKPDPGLNLSCDLLDTISTCSQLVSSRYPSVSVPASSYPSIQSLGKGGSYSSGISVGRSYAHQTAPGPRPKLSTEAREVMDAWFRDHYDRPYPSDAEKLELAQKCGIQLNQVNTFFGNKRMRLKRKAMVTPQRQNAAATGDSCTNAVDPSSVLAPQAKWRAVVLAKFPNAPSGLANSEDVPVRQGILRNAAGPSEAAFPGSGQYLKTCPGTIAFCEEVELTASERRSF